MIRTGKRTLVMLAAGDGRYHPAEVRIGRGTWIGSAAIVMADVGADAVVAAGAVVTKPLPDMTISGGVPARVLRHRDRRFEERLA